MWKCFEVGCRVAKSPCSLSKPADFEWRLRLGLRLDRESQKKQGIEEEKKSLRTNSRIKADGVREGLSFKGSRSEEEEEDGGVM